MLSLIHISVNVEELSEILTRVRKNLDEEISQRRDAALLRESYQKSLPILRAVFLNDLMRGTADAGMIEEKLKEYSVDILHEMCIRDSIHTKSAEKYYIATMRPWGAWWRYNIFLRSLYERCV